MFPPDFAKESIEEHTKPSDIVLDPFSGRGTTLLEALLGERKAIAADINPVAYCVSAAKASVPRPSTLEARLAKLEASYRRNRKRNTHPHRVHPTPFFAKAYHPETLRQVHYLRRRLDWRSCRTDRFLAALVLGHLHGEMDRSPNYFSNQMPHTISTKPDYSIAYWKDNELTAPKRDVFEILNERATFRLSDGRPLRRGRVVLSDVRRLGTVLSPFSRRVAAIVTSPPYLDVTCFEEDQWLRLWFLGGTPFPSFGTSSDDRHRSEARYFEFLEQAWRGVAPLMKTSAVLVCRVGSRRLTSTELADRVAGTIRRVWPAAKPIDRPRRTQLPHSGASLLDPTATGCRYEIDLKYRLAA